MTEIGKPCPACGRPLASGMHDVCFSEDRTRRYWLEADAPKGDPAKTCAFLLLNPSAADENATDHTVRKCVGFAEQGGYGRALIVNLFAYRSADPNMRGSVGDRVGEGNDAHIREAVLQADAVVCAWGNWGSRAIPRVIAVGEMLLAMGCQGKLHTLGELTGGGHPPHPAHRAYDHELQPWPDFAGWLDRRKRPA